MGKLGYESIFKHFLSIFKDVYGHEMTDSEADRENAEIIMRTLKSVFVRMYNAPSSADMINSKTNKIQASPISEMVNTIHSSVYND